MRVLIAGKHELAAALYANLVTTDFEIGFVTSRGEDPDGERTSLKGVLQRDGVQPMNQSFTHGELLRVVDDWKPDVLILAGFDKIIREPVIATVPHVVNVHFGDLPRYRGSFSIPWAILNREPVIGVTLHEVDCGIDSGAIIDQQHVPNDPGMSARDVYDACVDIGVTMVEEWLFLCATGHPPGARRQNEIDATYYPLDFPGGYQIEWRQLVRSVHDYVRACWFPPYPGACTHLGTERIEIQFPLSFELKAVAEAPGTIVDRAGRAGVTTLNGVIVPRRIGLGSSTRDFTPWVVENQLQGCVLGAAEKVSSPA